LSVGGDNGYAEPSPKPMYSRFFSPSARNVPDNPIRWRWVALNCLSVRGPTYVVCFRAFAAEANGGRSKLREHCLRPVERMEVRGEDRFAPTLSLVTPMAVVCDTD
jgi:hypothetical protein